MRTLTNKDQRNITPDRALEILKEGNDRFLHNLKAQKNLLTQVYETASGQYPHAVLLSCMDSRTSAELVFDQGLGHIFSIRVAGNVVNEDILGSMEYGCKVAGSKLVVVMGHSSCGAITAACKEIKMGNITALLSKIQPAVEELGVHTNTDVTTEYIQQVADLNVKLAIKTIRDKSRIMSILEKRGHIKIVGAMYHVESGKVEFFDE